MERGYIYVKVNDVKAGKKTSKPFREEKSIEYTGWSSNPRELFYFNTFTLCFKNTTEIIEHFHKDNTFLARFEVWFHPADYSKPERLLLEKTEKVYGWQR